MKRAVLISVAALMAIAILAPSSARAAAWVTDFSQFNADDYYEGISSYWDQNDENYVLTQAQGGQQGRIFYKTGMNMGVFTADFDVYIGGGDGDGSDGMTFAWVKAYDYEGGGGGQLDFFNADGFAVEFDTYQNGEYNDPNAQHIGLMKDGTDNHLATWEADEGVIDCDNWRHVKVTNYLGDVTVNWDGQDVINYQIEDYQAFDGYFGFTGATGGGYNWHRVDNVQIVIGGAKMELSTDTLEFGPVARGDSPTIPLMIRNVSQEENADIFSLNYTISDEGDAPDWLSLDGDAQGTVAPGDSIEADFVAATDGVELGEHERTVVIETNDPDHLRVELPARIFVARGFARLYGTVTDASNGAPIPGALVMTEFGFIDFTDAEGQYEIDRVPSIATDVTASAADFLDSTVKDVDIPEAGDIQLNFALLHSEFASDPTFFNKTLTSDTTVQLPLTISNIGNGPLMWGLRLAFPQGVDQPPWNLRESFFVGDSVNDNRIQGVVYIDGLFYVAGGEKDTNYIYVIDRDGKPVRQFHQMGSSRYGYSDLDYDGELIWGSSGSTFYGFKTNGDSVTSFASPVNNPSAIAWDPVDSLYWISTTSSDIYGVNRQGQQVGQRVRLANFQIYGLAYYPDDPDGRPLYIFRQYGDTLMVTKTSTARSDTMWVATLMPEQGGKAGGAFITRRYDPYSWVFITTANVTGGLGDRVDVWQLKANTGWVSVDPMGGVVDAGGNKDLTVTLNTKEMLAAEYHVDLAFRHDGVGGADTIPLNLTVLPADTNPPPPENHPPSAFDLAEPPDSSIYGAEILPFKWTTSVDPDSADRVGYLLWFGANGDPPVMIATHDTVEHVILRDFIDLPSNADNVVEWWVVALSGSDSVECRKRFVFFVPAPFGAQSDEIPFVFGMTSVAPNPFNSRLLVDYGLDRASAASVSIYDMSGREVSVLSSGRQAAGTYRLVWDASAVPSGVYLIRLSDATRVQTRKVVLVR